MSLEHHCSFRFGAHFCELNKRFISDPYTHPKTLLEFKYGLGAIGFYQKYEKYDSFATPF